MFLGYVRALRPKAFLLENVQGLSIGRPGMEAVKARVFLIIFTGEPAQLGIKCSSSCSTQCGTEYRSFAAGSLCSDSIATWAIRRTTLALGSFPRPTHGPGTSLPYVNVHEAIADLPVIGNGQANAKLSYAPRASHKGAYRRLMRRHAEQKIVTDHVTSRHADYVLERYKQIPPGGNWEDIAHRLTNYADVGRTHSNIYRRLRWDEPAITIGHYRKSMLVYPSQHRGLSLREACRLQSFPDWFEFAGSANGDSGGLVHKQQQLANAVSPLLTRAIANYLLRL